LGFEAVLMGASSLVAIMVGAAYTLGAARGIIAPPSLILPLGIALQVGLIVALPIDTVSGVIMLGLVSEAGLGLAHAAYFAWKLRERHR
jgi:hypothetical protein